MLDEVQVRKAAGPESAAQPGASATRPVRPGDQTIAVATQRQLIWWRFRKHKLAMAGAVVVLCFYLVVALADFLAYSDPTKSDGRLSLVPPQRVHLMDGWKPSPHVHPLVGDRDPVTFEKVYFIDESTDVPVQFLVHGYSYKLFGLVTTDIHLFGTPGQGQSLFLLGTDEEGRDLYSRLLRATQTSLLIGLGGVAISVMLGLLFGSISGFYGGVVDTVIQRAIEILRSIPTIPLWMGLAAAIPSTWSVGGIVVAIAGIIAITVGTELARVVRGRFLQIRGEDFVTAAELVGARPRRIIFVHMLPLFTSHIIAATTLALPLMIIAETSLSFLGLGLRPPAISWGVMLQQAQNVQSIALSPWMLLPVIPVVVAILAFNFLGDGLRDAADPYDA